MISANKGEWSELYVLFILLGDGRVYAGDGKLQRLEAYYPVLKILRDELKRSMAYELDHETQMVIVSEDGRTFARLSASNFMEQAQQLFAKIQNGGNERGAFTIPTIEPFLNDLHCCKVKAKSTDKADIHIVIHDFHTGLTPQLGFSIKSSVGAASTLLNASGATVIQYRIVGSAMDDAAAAAINAIHGNRKMQRRIEAIAQAGCSMQFNAIPNPAFDNNLRMIDSQLPEIVGWMLADAYQRKQMALEKAVESITQANPLHYDLRLGHDHYGYKVRSLLVAAALGMLPATPWEGRYDATGGYLVVKEDGDVLCFHVYDRNLLGDYLFNNTKFETPDTKRYPMGTLYRHADNYYINLVLDIRFK